MVPSRMRGKQGCAKPSKRPKPHAKHVAAARVLRDRYLEQFNAGRVLGKGKYDVARALPSPGGLFVPSKQLPQAA